jgi:hypothetical protein
MKKVRIILFTIAMVSAPFLTQQLNAQPPTPNTGNQGGTAMGGGSGTAPIEGGIAILITLAASYGVRKATLAKKEKEETI